MKKAVVKKSVADWKKKKGIKTHYPNDIILPLKKVNPKDYNLIYKLNLTKDNANRYVYYYAADSKNIQNCLKPKYASNAYGEEYLNKGVTKTDKNGIASLRINCPQSYYVNKDKQYISHIHYLLSDKENKKWEEKMFTERIICSVNKNELKKIIENQCAMIINALPYEEFIKQKIPNSIPLPYDIVDKNKITEKQLLKYLEEMSVHYPKINKLLKSGKLKIENVPIIVYCYKKTCKASEILIDKLIEYGYTDIKEYPNGIIGWDKK